MGGAFGPDEKRVLIRYLLGELSEKDRNRTEEQFFADGHCFEELIAAEQGLIDRYLRGELCEAERESFERRYLDSPARRARVDFARALNAKVTAAGAPETKGRAFWSTLAVFPGWLQPSTRFAVAAASFATVVCIVWLGYETVQVRHQLVLLQRNEDVRAALFTAELQKIRAQRDQRQAEGTVVAFLLTPGITRDVTDARRFVIPAGAKTVRLQLAVPAGSGDVGYRAAVRTPDGNEIWSEGALTAQGADSGKLITLTVPAGVIATGEYTIRLKHATARGVAALESYLFNVLRE